jgi:hypothetical protein
VNVVTVDSNCHCLCCKSCYTLENMEHKSQSTIATPAVAQKTNNMRVNRFSKPAAQPVQENNHKSSTDANTQKCTDRMVQCPSCDGCEGPVSLWFDPEQDTTEALLLQYNQINASLNVPAPSLMRKAFSSMTVADNSGSKRSSTCACECSGCRCRLNSAMSSIH